MVMSPSLRVTGLKLAESLCIMKPLRVNILSGRTVGTVSDVLLQNNRTSEESLPLTLLRMINIKNRKGETKRWQLRLILSQVSWELVKLH